MTQLSDGSLEKVKQADLSAGLGRANIENCASSDPLKAAEILNGGASPYEHSCEVVPLVARGQEPDDLFIIGFDAEWVKVPTEPEDEDDAAEEPLPTNQVLSYQYACRHDRKAWTGIVFTRPAEAIRSPDLSADALAAIPERLRFADLLALAIKAGLAGGYIRQWPKHVIATAHWTRADLSAMADFAEINTQFDGVQKTYVTLSRPYEARVTFGKRVRPFAVTLVDTQLLVPGTSRALATLGDLYKFPKLDPGIAPDGSKYIEHMDWLLRDNPQLYAAYAIRDAEISALHVETINRFVRVVLGMDRLPPTLGGVSVEVLRKYWEDHDFSEGAINGYETVKRTRFNRASRCYLTKPERKYHPNFSLHQKLAEECFHGGRNECYAYGPTSTMADVYDGNEVDGPVIWREFDLKGAYATALSALQIPDYDAAHVTLDPADFSARVMGFALVRFRFPKDCRFPCLPVEADHDHGLIYPRCGEAYATGPEIELARRLGAELEIIHGIVVPWVKDSPYPFREVIKELRDRRSEYEKDTLPNELFKQLGNGIYGKLGQGIKGNTAFNTRTGSHEEIGESKITNVYLAAHVTGLIRALLGELIAAAGVLWTVISATTDSIITNCQFSEIELGGPLARYMIGVAEALEGQPDNSPGRGILEKKFEAFRLFPWRTRGIATLSCDGPPKLAKAGMRAPEGSPANDWFVRAMSDRQPGDKYRSSEPISFSDAHRRAADHVFKEREKTFNFEFDFKRKPVTPVPKYYRVPQLSEDQDICIVQHLSFNSVPWETIEEFNKTRELFELFRLKSGGQLKTQADWERWRDFQAGTKASRAGLRRSKDGPVAQALRIFIRAYVRGAWGLPGGDYRKAADALTSAGYPTREQAFKDARRRPFDLPENTIPTEARGVPELVAALKRLFPGFEAERLVEGGSAKSPICAGEKVTSIEQSQSLNSEVVVLRMGPHTESATPSAAYAAPQ